MHSSVFYFYGLRLHVIPKLLILERRALKNIFFSVSYSWCMIKEKKIFLYFKTLYKTFSRLLLPLFTCTSNTQIIDLIHLLEWCSLLIIRAEPLF